MPDRLWLTRNGPQRQRGMVPAMEGKQVPGTKPSGDGFAERFSVVEERAGVQGEGRWIGILGFGISTYSTLGANEPGESPAVLPAKKGMGMIARRPWVDKSLGFAQSFRYNRHLAKWRCR
jgi:hypothetical protein